MKEIIVYSKNNCMQCKMLKNILTKDNINFKEINTDEHPQFISHIKGDLGYSSLPVLEFEEFTFSGFNPDKIKELKQLVN